MNRREKELFYNAVKFCFQNDNPSVFALQTIFDLTYEKAVALRVKLIENGFVSLYSNKRKIENASFIIKIKNGGYVKVSNN